MHKRGFNNSGVQIWSTTLTGSVWNLKETQDINTDGITDIVVFIGFSGTIKHYPEAAEVRYGQWISAQALTVI